MRVHKLNKIVDLLHKSYAVYTQSYSFHESQNLVVKEYQNLAGRNERVV